MSDDTEYGETYDGIAAESLAEAFAFRVTRQSEALSHDYVHPIADSHDGGLSSIIEAVLRTLAGDAEDLPAEGLTRSGVQAWLAERIEQKPGGLRGLLKTIEDSNARLRDWGKGKTT